MRLQPVLVGFAAPDGDGVRWLAGHRRRARSSKAGRSPDQLDELVESAVDLRQGVGIEVVRHRAPDPGVGKHSLTVKQVLFDDQESIEIGLEGDEGG